MTDGGYPFACMVHDLCNYLFCKKRKLLENNGWYKTMSGLYTDGHGNILNPRDYTYTQLKQRLHLID